MAVIDGTEHRPLCALADRLRDASESERVTVADVVDAIGRRSLLPLLLVPALLAATPLSGVPGVSAVMGLLIAVISFQMLLRYDSVRLPGVLMRQSVEGRKLRAALDKAHPVIGWIDRHTRRRMTALFHRPLLYIPEIVCLLSGLAMPFLEFIPFTSSIVATGVSFLALSLLTRDGLLFLLALLPYTAAAAVIGPRLI